MGLPKGKSERDANQHIQVAVRLRPLNGIERRKGSYSVVEANSEKKEVSVKERTVSCAPTKAFSFDKVFGINSKQIEVYRTLVSPLMDEVVQGYNCTVFAYGQTGTGKTFTMEGERSEDSTVAWDEDPLIGIIPRAMCHLFSRLQKQNCEFSVRVSFLEIYNEELIDLLGAESVDNPKLKIYEDTARKAAAGKRCGSNVPPNLGSCVIHGLEEVVVQNKDEVYQIMERGSHRRQTAATLMNAHSSRSHSVFMVTVHIKENNIEGEELLKIGKLNLVDLAGSECIGRSGAQDKRAREAGQINQSLLTLGRVITALVEHAPHIPYRESKLTRLLQDSLGGRTKTSIIATISPAHCNLEETLSTLDYAHRAKNITNRPEVNQKLTKKALLKEYTVEIETLRRDLQAARDKNGIFLAEENYTAMTTQILQQKDALHDMEEKIEALNTDLIKTSELFTLTKEELEEATTELKDVSNQLTDTQQMLANTQANLRKTTQDRDEQKHLVSAHVKTEIMLHGQATQLLSTADSSTADVSGLHEKLDRVRETFHHNETASEALQRNFRTNVDSMKGSLDQHTHSQLEFNSRLTRNLAAVMERRSSEVTSLCTDLSTLVSVVQQRVSTLSDTFDEHTSQSTDQLTDINNICAKVKEEEVERQATFHEKTFVAAVSLVQEMLQKHNNSLSTLSELLQKQLSSQQAASARFACEQREQLQQTRDLVDKYCSAETERLQAHEQQTRDLLTEQDQRNQLLTNTLVADIEKLVKEMHSQAKSQRHEHSEQMVSSFQKTRGCTEEFKTSSLDHVSQLVSQSERSEQELYKKTKEDGEAAQYSIDQLREDVSTLTEKTTCIKSDVATFTLQTQSNISSKMSELIESVQNHSQHLHKTQQQLHTDTQSMVSECEETGRGMEDKQSSQHTEFTDNMQCEQSKVEGNSKDVAEWSERTNSELEQQYSVVNNFVSEELLPDKPTGLTPKPRQFTYPHSLSRTSRHSLILEDFRKDYVMNEAVNTPVPDDSFESLMSQAAADLEGERSGDESNGHSEISDISADSAISSAFSGASNTENKENVMGPPTRRPSTKSTARTSPTGSVDRSSNSSSRSNSLNRANSRSNTPTKTPSKTQSKTPGKSRLAATTKPNTNNKMKNTRLPLKSTSN